MAGRDIRALGFIVARIKYYVGRYDAIDQNFLLVVDIINETIQCETALHKATADFRPISRRNHPRDNIKGPGPVDVFALTIDSKGDTHVT